MSKFIRQLMASGHPAQFKETVTHGNIASAREFNLALRRKAAPLDHREIIRQKNKMIAQAAGAKKC